MPGKAGLSKGVPGNERMVMFSDGVFAIAITLLVLELKVPEHAPQGGLIYLLPDLASKFAGHVVSFVVLGVYWVGHHNMFMHIHRHNRVLLWLNILFLMCVAAMPFFAGLVTQHGEDTTALVAYAGNLVLAGFFLDLTWWYASSARRLVDQNIDSDLVAFVHRRVLLAPVLYLASIGVALFNHAAAMVLFVIVPLFYIFPSPLDRYHHRQLDGVVATEDE